jgi:hypothetical protein
MFELAGFEGAEFEGVGDLGNVYAVIALSGSATVECVPTTDFIDLIESGGGSMTFAAEIHLRSL